MAAFTLSASSFVISRPAFPGVTAGLGSSVVIGGFEDCVDIVVDKVVASWVIKPSGVRNSDLAASRSCRMTREGVNKSGWQRTKEAIHPVPYSLEIQNP